MLARHSKARALRLISREASQEKDSTTTHLSGAPHSSTTTMHPALLSAERERGANTNKKGGRWRWSEDEQTVKYDLWTLLLLRFFHSPCFPVVGVNNADSSEGMCVQPFFHSAYLSHAHKHSGKKSLPLSIPYPLLLLPFLSFTQRSICADFLKGLQGVTWTEWMGLIAFSKVEADLYKRKWIECFSFLTLYSIAPVMHVCHFVKLLCAFNISF